MSRRFSRRRFLQQTILTSVAIPLVGPRLVRAQSPNEKVNIAVVGVAGRGGSRLHAWGENQNIVALCDTDRNHLGNAAKRFPNAKTYDDWRVMLDKQHNEIDAVAVSTPDHNHAIISIAAMKLGKHVYCEKPLTRSIYEARQMANVAAEMKVATQMGNQAHAGGGVRILADWLGQGAIGDVHEVHAWSDRPIWPQGMDQRPPSKPVPGHLNWDAWIGPAPYRDYHDGLHGFRWRGWWDFGTGALGDMGCHIIDPLFWGLDLRHPTKVEVEAVSGKHEETGPTWSVVKWHFPKRGNLPPCVLVWHDGKGREWGERMKQIKDKEGKVIREEKERYPEQNFPPRPKELEGSRRMPSNGTMCFGSTGVLFASHGSGPRIIPEEKMRQFTQPERKLPRSPGHDQEFINGCKGGDQPMANFAYAAALTETVLLGNVALRAGKTIEWDAAKMRATNAPEADAFIHPPFREGWSL